MWEWVPPPNKHCPHSRENPLRSKLSPVNLPKRGDNQFGAHVRNALLPACARAQVISAVKKKFKICKRGDVMSQLMFHRWIIYVRKLIFCQASSKIMWWAWWLWWSDNSAWWQIQRWTFMPRSAPMNKETSEHIGRLVRSFICPIELKCDLKQHLQFQTSIWTHMFCVQGGGFEFLFRCDFRIIQRWTNFLEEQFKN